MTYVALRLWLTVVSGLFLGLVIRSSDVVVCTGRLLVLLVVVTILLSYGLDCGTIWVVTAARLLILMLIC